MRASKIKGSRNPETATQCIPWREADLGAGDWTLRGERYEREKEVTGVAMPGMDHHLSPMIFHCTVIFILLASGNEQDAGIMASASMTQY
jgi:hypothetical protein